MYDGLCSMCISTSPHSTGKERDTAVVEPGNDFFGARYYNSTIGRWLSPDWTMKANDPVPYAKLDNPQSLNLYSYVYNNPLARDDPDGHVAAGTGCRQGKEKCDAAIKKSNEHFDKVAKESIENLPKAVYMKTLSPVPAQGTSPNAPQGGAEFHTSLLGLKAKVGGMSQVVEGTTQFQNQSHRDVVDSAGGEFSIGPFNFGDSVKREKTIQKGTGPEKSADTEPYSAWHNDSDANVSFGAGGCLGPCLSIEFGINLNQLYPDDSPPKP